MKLTAVKTTCNWLNSRPQVVWLAAALSLAWLALAVPFLSLHEGGVRPIFSPEKGGNQDFPHYYMGGAILLEGRFESLYPVPNEDLKSNVGWVESSQPKEGYQQVAEQRGVEDSLRYILPPPTTLLLAPFASLPYQTARWVWVVLLGASCWGICFLSFRLIRQHGGSQLIAVAWLLGWSFSPLMLKTLRTANSTPFVALLFALAALAIFQNKRASAASFSILAGLLKGTSLIFAPLLLIMKRWGIIAIGAVAALIINGVMLLISGPGVYREFFEVVYPSTKIPDPFMGNQGIFGCLLRLFGELSPTATTAIRICGLLLMTLLLVRFWKIRARLDSEFATFNIAVLCLLGTYLIFGAYCWEQYILFYLPFAAVFWTTCKTLRGRIMIVGFAVLTWCPLVSIRGGALVTAEPMQSHMLWGQILLILAAVMELPKPRPEPMQDAHG